MAHDEAYHSQASATRTSHKVWNFESFFIFYFLKFFLVVPHLATFIVFLSFNVIASNAYIHLVYGGIRTHVLLKLWIVWMFNQNFQLSLFSKLPFWNAQSALFVFLKMCQQNRKSSNWKISNVLFIFQLTFYINHCL